MKSYILVFTILIFCLSGNVKSFQRNSTNKRTQKKEIINKDSKFDSSDIIPLQLKNKKLSATVFGFLPDDNYLTERNNIHYDLLTHIGCIAFDADSLGNVSDPPYWPWTDVIDSAHENGVKVILCTTNFVASQMHYLLNSDSAKQNLFTNLKNKLLMYKLDGVNVDFERFYSTDSGDILNNFMSQLTVYLHNEVPGCEISFAGPHYNWGGNWKFTGLANACDYIVIMGYAYAGSFSSNTGSNAPIIGGTQNLTNTLTQQYRSILNSNPKKLILGVPYYGNKWFTRTSDPHAAVVSFLYTQPYSKNILEGEKVGIRWDTTEESPWYTWKINDSTWCQVWFDNDSSLGLKYDLAMKYNLKGVGMWALGYDGNSSDLWNVIENKFEVTDVRNGNILIPTFKLFQNYPNPFNPSTTINYSVPKTNLVTIKVYDILGREVETLVNDRKAAGNYKVEFNASKLASGIYFYQMRAGNFISTKKLVLLK